MVSAFLGGKLDFHFETKKKKKQKVQIEDI